MDNQPKNEYKVAGKGRVGSYAAAKRGGYSRSRRYWRILKRYDNPEYLAEKDTFDRVTKPRYIWKEVEEFGRFPTKGKANQELAAIGAAAGAADVHEFFGVIHVYTNLDLEKVVL